MQEHFKRNKKRYICLGIGLGVGAGITWFIMRERYASMQSVVDGPSRATVRSLLFFSDNNIVTTMHNGDRGHPGFRVRSLDFNTEYNTQWQAAKAFDISPAMLSSHLNGKVDNVNGLHFERIPA